MSEVLYHSAEELVAAKVFAFRKGMESQRERSIIGRELTDEADQVREALQVIRRSGPSVLAQALRERVGLLRSLLGAAWRQALSRRDVRLDQVVQGVEPVSEGSNHQRSPEVGGFAADEETIARRIIAHRLSETPK